MMMMMKIAKFLTPCTLSPADRVPLGIEYLCSKSKN